jgi:hypothetical protein
MKAILLVRISSDTQEIDEQTNDLIDEALDKGYSIDNQIKIEDTESAIKLVEKDRKGLAKLKEYIQKDSTIDAVFVWELSRIARTMKVGIQVRDFLVENKIQLYCKSPSFALLNKDRTEIESNSDLTYTLFLQLAESEMKNKKARFHRSKKRNARTGKYSGGFIKFGYNVDDKGFYQINESEADLIRYIFNEYEKGRSIMNLTKELLQRGKITTTNFVRGILISEAYTGLSNEYKMNRIYPQIISIEQFNKCREVAKNNNKRADKSNEIYFAKKLIKCVECGTHYIAMKTSIMYLCYGRYGKEAKLNPEMACKSSPVININMLDSLLWRLAKKSEQFRSDIGSEDELIELKEKIKSNKQHIEESTISLSKLEKKKERIADNYIDGVYTKEKRDDKFKIVDKQIFDTTNYIVSNRNENNKIEKRIKSDFKPEYSGQELIDYLKNEIKIKGNRLASIDDDAEKQIIIQKNIKEINVLENEANKSKILVIKYYNDRIERYRVRVKKRPPIVEMDVALNYDEFSDTFIPIQPPLKITQRFIRNKQSKIN